MSKVIFNIPTSIKKAATKRAEREGLTLTAILAQLLRAYAEEKISITVMQSPISYTKSKSHSKRIS